MDMVKQYDVFWVILDPTVGREIKKTRPCVVISPNEMNGPLATVLIAPLTSTVKSYPFRINCIIKDKPGSIALDQIRCVDKTRLGKKILTLPQNTINDVRKTISEMLIK